MFWLSAALKLLPGIANAVASVINKTKDVTITAYTTSVGIATAQARYATAVLSHPLSAPSILCYAVALYYGKAIAYDNVISFWITGHAGFTPPLVVESTAYVSMVVISGMFFSGIAGIIKRS